MNDAQMNRKMLAEKSGVHMSNISKFIHGKGIPRRDTVERLAEALGVKVEYLMGESNEKIQLFAEEITPKNAEGYNDPTAYNAMKNIEKDAEIKRGEVYEYHMTNGQEMTYAVIVSSDERGSGRFVSVVVLDDEAHGNSAAVVAHGLKYADCNKVTFAMTKRLGAYIRTATDEEMRDIDNALAKALGIDDDLNKLDGELNEQLQHELDAAHKELKEATAIIEERNAKMEAMRDEFMNLREGYIFQEKVIEELKAKLEERKKEQIAHAEPSVRFERDFYKAQYESLLAKIIERAV
jgi:transcriptional regulator with XRE-family HTH domain